ncbi:hypothetical protein [Clostridium algidicarnis]|uniref:hypothetical protein n=1 Tax=Clostridium algidicarnis TaxID=37659 RepID=UPI001C0C8FFE|nr:hypothetical protein [Clostridium algidicarnis]MBU3203726.1 hypothetical protein [Clostridium algidicarnis]MBU3211880.1 hypothetical protein [Clostridium algidicarnis]MBU3221614.1 hypothetical protein [Clostridium algidicarnis]
MGIVYKTKMEWCFYNDGTKIVKKYVDNIEKEEYDYIYKRKLTCIHGCEAKVKFTQKKNKKKFFSTWNKDGKKHNENCEYHVQYTDELGRKKLKAIAEHIQVNDEQIEAALKRKIKNLKKEFRGEINESDNLGSKVIINTGESDVKVGNDDADGNGDKVSKRENITSIDASLINSTYENRRKCVYGRIDNVQYSHSESSELYGYLNLVNDYYKVSVYFPTSYYEGNEFKKEELEKTLEILKTDIEKNNKKTIVTCYGEIKSKKGKKNDYNIHVINPKHILINEMSMNKILTKGELEVLDYDII